MKSTSAFVPDWSYDATWYQVFPDRFRNGCPASNPRLDDVSDHPIQDWAVCDWGLDWYGCAPWEQGRRDFYKTVFNRRFGGDLVGLRDKLDYLQDLGVNAIYCNPVFKAPSLHKYDAACLHHIDPTLGPDRDGDERLLAAAGETDDPATWIWTAADRFLVDLVAEIHRRGMRIILDGVFNHTGTRFFAFQDLRRNGRKSRYADWYRIDKWHDDHRFEYKGWFGFHGLPELGRDENNLNPQVRDYLFAITRRWMDPAGAGLAAGEGIDGWRLDVAFCVPHEFWKEWRRVVRSINPQAYLTAEIVSLATPYLQGDEFDGVMNYMWTYPTLSFFSTKSPPVTAATVQQQLQAVLDAYPPEVNHVVQNLFDSHDTGRVLTAINNPERPMTNWDEFFNELRVQAHPDLRTTRPDDPARQILRQMVVFQMTYLGAPMIYYGTEVGMWGANDPDDRQPMLWNDITYEPETHTINGQCPPAPRRPDMELFAFYQRAIRLRKEHPVLRRGQLRWIETGTPRLLGFVRYDERTEVTALFNAGDDPLAHRVSLPARDLWDPETNVCDPVVRIPPRGFRVLMASKGT